MIYIEKSKLNIADMWLIPLDRATYIYIYIYGRSHADILYSPCNGLVNPEAQIGGLWVLADHIRKNKCNANVSTIFARHGAFHACLPSRSDRTRVRWHMHLTNHGYFDYGEKPEDPQFGPHAWIKMAQVLGSPVYVYGNWYQWFLIRPKKETSLFPVTRAHCFFTALNPA